MKADSYKSYFTDKQGDNIEILHNGMDTVCPVRVQAKSGVAGSAVVASLGGTTGGVRLRIEKKQPPVLTKIVQGMLFAPLIWQVNRRRELAHLQCNGTAADQAQEYGESAFGCKCCHY